MPLLLVLVDLVLYRLNKQSLLLVVLECMLYKGCFTI
uniref:Uncharacterized protein n=1 Tax=Picea sitchensis TaxID=3332 RepID=A0A6B9XTW3_PICSI|nr:hypothetical protein Q903MT_gene5543 [Picea sitchensis]